MIELNSTTIANQQEHPCTSWSRPTASASDTRSARGVGMPLTIRIDDLEGPELECNHEQ
jgi:hypothetical protein